MGPLVIIAIAAAGVLSGCLSSPFGKKEKTEDTPEDPCPPSAGGETLEPTDTEQPNSSEDTYTTYSYPGPVWPGASPQPLTINLAHGINPVMATYINEQIQNCGAREIQRLGLSGPFPTPKVFVTSASKTSSTFRGVITLPRHLYERPPTDWRPGDGKCDNPNLAHEDGHVVIGNGGTVAFKKNYPKNRILEEGLPEKLSQEVTDRRTITSLAEQPLDPVSIDPTLRNYLTPSGQPLMVAFSSAQLTNAAGAVTEVYVHSGPVEANNASGLAVEENGRKIDDCRSASDSLYALGIKSFCFFHDRAADQTLLETGTFFLIGEDLTNYFQSGLNKETICLPSGTQEVQFVDLGAGRRLPVKQSAIAPYGISLNPAGDYIDQKSYSTGACFWNHIEQTYGTPAFQAVVKTLKEARAAVTMETSIDVIALMAASLMITEVEMEGVFNKFNIPPSLFRNQVIAPVCN